MDLLLFLTGVLLGGVVNLLADSLPIRRRPEWPSCQACGAPRPWRAWSGLASVLLGVRRCPYCGRSRRGRAPVVEVLAGLGVVGLAHLRPNLQSLLPAIFIGCVFLLVLVLDIEHRLIPHVVTLPSAVVIGLMGILDPARGPVKTLLGGLAGFSVVFLMYLLGIAFSRWISRRRGESVEEIAFGFGDVTLAVVIGLAVGWPGVLVALVLGILAAGIFSLGAIVVMLIRRRYRAFLAIPYGPFLVFGALLVYLGGRDLFSLLLTP